MNRKLRVAVQLAVFMAALASIGLTITAADLDAPATRVLGLIFAAWVAAPYVVLLHATTRSAADALHGWVLLLATIALAAFGLAIYYDAMFVHLDPQSGIVFLVVPVWQMIAAGAVVVVLHRRLARRAIESDGGGA